MSTFALTVFRHVIKAEGTEGNSVSVANTAELAVDFWDTAGQERFASLIPMYYRDSDLIFLVCDLSDSYSIEKIDYYMDKFVPSLDKEYWVIIIGNKLDLMNSFKIQNANSRIMEITKKYDRIQDKIIYQNVSTKTGEKYEDLIVHLHQVGKLIMEKKTERGAIKNYILLPEKEEESKCQC
jgi:GTPase SAR1 family protein